MGMFIGERETDENLEFAKKYFSEKELDVNVESYSQVQKMANEQHLENICTNLSENRKEEFIIWEYVAV